MAVHGHSSCRVVTAPPLARRAPISNAALRDEVLRGLRATPKTLPPKLFYDERGAQLFERICAQPEYYLTRAELEILGRVSAAIATLAGPRAS